MDDDALKRFRSKPRFARIVYAHQRLFASILFGIIVALVVPAAWRPVTRLLSGWDAGAALYILFAFFAIATADRAHIRHKALMQDDGRFVVLILTLLFRPTGLFVPTPK